MSLRDAVESTRQSKIELALIHAESRIYAYDGKIFSRMKQGLKGLGVGLVMPLKMIGSIFVGAMDADVFDAQVSVKVAEIDAVLAEKKQQWEMENRGRSSSYSITQSIHDDLISRLTQAGMESNAGNKLLSGKVFDAMGEAKRAQFEMAYRENVLNPEAAMERRDMTGYWENRVRGGVDAGLGGFRR